MRLNGLASWCIADCLELVRLFFGDDIHSIVYDLFFPSVSHPLQFTARTLLSLGRYVWLYGHTVDYCSFMTFYGFDFVGLLVDHRSSIDVGRCVPFYRRHIRRFLGSLRRDDLINSDLRRMFGVDLAGDMYAWWTMQRNSPTHVESLGHILCLHYGVPQQLRLLGRQISDLEDSAVAINVDAEDLVFRWMS